MHRMVTNLNEGYRMLLSLQKMLYQDITSSETYLALEVLQEFFSDGDLLLEFITRKLSENKKSNVTSKIAKSSF